MFKQARKTLLAAIAMMAYLSLNHASAQVIEPSLVEVGLSTAYFPTGFDSNDRAIVMVESYLPNTCYKIAQEKVIVDESAKTVTIQQMAYRYNGICLMVIVPYYHMTDLGILKAGNYKVMDSASRKNLGELPISLATSPDADDFLYAPVSEVNFDQSVDSQFHVSLTGSFTDSCVYLKEVKVIKESKNVITVLPVSAVRENQKCVAGEFPFKSNAVVTDLNKGRYLLHVRSLNGQSLGKLVDVQ